MERTNSGALILTAFVLLAAYLFPFYPSAGTAYELTDWATTAALVETNGADISGLRKSVEIDFPSTLKTADGKEYSTRAPGIALMSAPVYALTRIFLGPPNKGNVQTSWFVLRIFVSTLPLLLLAFWLYGREIDSYTLAVLLFATPLFPYSLLLYPHVISAILVYLGFRMIYDQRRVKAETCFSAAFLFGVAIACQYLAVVPALIFGIGLLTTERIDRFRRLLFFVSGAVPPLVVLFVHQYLVFGNPFAFALRWTFTMPGVNTFYEYFVSPSYGLVVFAPIMIFGVFVLLTSNESGLKRHNLKLTAVIVTFLAVCFAHPVVEVDSIGPRHLILIMPLLLDSLFDGEIEEYPSHWRGLLFSVSMISCSLPMLTYAFAPTQLAFPHNSFWGPLIFGNSVFGLTIANTFGYAVSSWTVLPVIVILAIVLFLVWRDAKYPVAFALGLLVGIGLMAVYIFAAPLEPQAAANFIETVVSTASK